MQNFCLAAMITIVVFCRLIYLVIKDSSVHSLNVNVYFVFIMHPLTAHKI